MKKAILLLLIILSSIQIYSQSWMQYLPQNRDEQSLTYYDYQAAFNEWCRELKIDQEGYYINKNGARQKAYGWKQFKRWEIQVQGTFDRVTGRFLREEMSRVMSRYYSSKLCKTNNLSGNWTNLTYGNEGYGNNGNGRLQCMAFHPTDPQTYWVGTGWGGLWSTTDDGQSWTPLSDYIDAICIAAIAIPSDYSTSHTIYIGTGDRDYYSNRGVGVLKSTDAGMTWQNTGLSFDITSESIITRLLIDPTNDDIIYAGSKEGIYKSVDAGEEWEKLVEGRIQDLDFHPEDPEIIYATSRPKYQDNYARVLRSLDGGENWDTVFQKINCIRIEVAVCPAKPDWVYAVISKSDGGLKGVYRSTNSGGFFIECFDGLVIGNNLLAGCNPTASGGQGDFDLVIAVNPQDGRNLTVGGVDLYQSNDTALSFSLLTDGYNSCSGINNNVHVDHHWLEYQPVTNRLFACSDGGVYFSSDNGGSFTNISGGLIINQPYRLGCSQQFYNKVLMGQQDNGVVLWSGNSIDFVGGGDAGTSVINPSDVNNQFFSNNNKWIVGTLNHWNSFFDVIPPNDSSGAWFKPIIALPPDTILFGYSDLWQSIDKGQTLTKVFDFPDTAQLEMIAVSEMNHKVMFAVNSKNVYKTTDGGVNWQNMTSVWPMLPEDCYRITIKNSDPDVVWVTEVSWGDGKSVFRSEDGGLVWENISQGLPDASWYDIVQNKLQTGYEELYVSGFFGTWLKLGDNPWIEFNNGLPTTVSYDMEIFYDGSESKLRTATHGRGIWETSLFSVESDMPGIWTGVQSTDWYDSGNWAYLTVPSASSDITIPANCPFYPSLSSSDIYCNSLTIEEGAELEVLSQTIEIVEDMIINGNLMMNGTGTRKNKLIIHGNIFWGESAAFSAVSTYNSQILLYRDWNFNPGSQSIHLDYLDVFLLGNDFSTIYSNGYDSRFGHLYINKLSGKSVSIASSSTTSLTIAGDLTINEEATLFHNSSFDLNIYGNISATGNLFFLEGQLNLSGQDKTIYIQDANSYLNGVKIVLNGSDHSYTLLSDIHIKGNLILTKGILNAESFNLKLDKDLIKSNGLLYQTTGRIIFQGTTPQYVSGTDYNIGAIELAKPGDTLFFEEYLSLKTSSYYYTSGILKVAENAEVEFSDLGQDGIFGHFILRDQAHITLHQSSGSIDLNGIIKIDGGEFIVSGGTSISNWPGDQDAELWISSGTLDFKDQGIYLNDNYNLLEVITGGVIRTTGSFISERNDFTPVGGYVELYGNGNVSLSHGIGGGLFDLHINKSTSSDKVSVIQNLDIDHNLSVLSGNLDINGRTVDVAGDADITGKLSMTLESSELNVVSDITWLPGSSSNITNGQISFRGNWTYSNGTNASLTGANTVTVEGNINSSLLNNDPDASFANFICNKSALMTVINQSSGYPLQINGNLTLMPGDIFTPGAVPIIVNGTTSAQATSNFLLGSSGQLMLNIAQFDNVQDIPSGVIITVNELVVNHTMNLASGGSVTSDNLVLNGILNVNGGDMLIHGDFLQNSSGHLTLNSGSFILDRPYTGNLFGFSGTTDLNGGFFEITYDGIQFGTGANVNFNGGNLRVGGHFRAILPDSFQPTAGAIELINTIGASIECSNGNYFHDLIIYKTGGNPSILGTPVTINHDLLLNRGSLTTFNQTLTVGGDLTIESLANLAAGSSDIYIGGSWENKRGTNGFSEGTSTVTFNTAQSGTLGSETFFRLEVDKFAPSGVHLTLNEGSVLTVSNDFTASLGSLKLSNNSTFNAQGMVHLKDGGGIYVLPAAQNVLLNFYGDWKNYNPVTDENHGFEPGNSTTNICGNADQDLIAPFGTSFGKLVLLKTSGNFLPSGDITVMGDLDLQSGNWSYATTGLELTLRKNMTIGSSANWLDDLNAVVFAGGGIHYLQNNNPSLLSLGKIVIDQQYDFEQDLDFRILNDFACNVLRINNGYTTIDNLDVICNDSLLVGNSGSCLIYNGTVLRMGDAANIHVNGGNLTFAGSTANPSLVTRKNSAYYEFLVENQGSLNAVNAIFEYLDDKGINLDGNGIIEGEFPLYNCTFRNGKPGGYFLLLNNSQDVTLYNVNFQTNAGFGAKNAAKSVSTGNVRFTDAYGNFAGPAFEYDPNNRIHWPGAGIWEGDVSTAWHNPLNWHFDFQVPDASTDVVIPSGKPNYPVFSLEDTTIHSLFMEPNTSLTITKDSLTVTSWADIAGTLNFFGDYTALFTDSLVWQSGSSASMVSRSTIYLTGDMFVKRGSNLALNDGLIYFYGNKESNLRCHDTAQIFNLSNYKNVAYSLNLAGDTSALLTVNGNFVNGTSATLKCPSTQEWVFNGNFRNTADGHIRCSNGTIKLRGNITSTYFRLKQGDYFNNLTIETPSRVNLYYISGYSDTLRVNGNLVFNSRSGGTSGLQANNFKIMLRGDWINNAGTSAFVTGAGQTHRVVFWDPYNEQQVIGNTNFYHLYALNESAGGLSFYDLINLSYLVVGFPVHVYGTLNASLVNNDDSPSEIHLYDGSYLQALSLIQGGFVHMHGGNLAINDLAESYILGNYIIDNGLAVLNQTEYSTSHNLLANITINGGELRFTGGDGSCMWPGTNGVARLTMTGGLLNLSNHWVQITSGNFSENISGGKIIVNVGFYCDENVSSFHPTGGAVEINGENDCGISIPSYASWFWDLYINNGNYGGVTYPSTAIKIKNELKVISGTLDTGGFPVIVGP